MLTASRRGVVKDACTQFTHFNLIHAINELNFRRGDHFSLDQSQTCKEIIYVLSRLTPYFLCNRSIDDCGNISSVFHVYLISFQKELVPQVGRIFFEINLMNVFMFVDHKIKYLYWRIAKATETICKNVILGICNLPYPREEENHPIQPGTIHSIN